MGVMMNALEPPSVAGPRDGELVVLVHGFPQTPAAWDDVVPVLAGAGYRAVAPWLPGYVAGSRPDRDELRLGRAADDVAALATDLGAASFHVVGHDWGALVAWRLASAYPDRVTTLAALSVPHPRAMLAAMPAGQAWRSAYSLFFRMPGSDRLLAANGGRQLRALLGRTGLPEAFVRRYVDHHVGQGTLRAALDWYRVNGWGELRRVDLVNQPTLFLWGRDDPAIGRAAACTCQRYTTGPYHFEPLDEGHWLPERQPEAVAAAVLDHLGRHRSGPG
jgi:pimeloyl-ACP methyl ester carboxylesterase